MTYGIAIDIGTSGTRAHAVDLSSSKILSTVVTECHPLPGANVMDHLTFCINVGNDIAHRILMDTQNKVIHELGIDLHKVERVSICGNPIQLSLFQGIPVDDLAFAGENAKRERGIKDQERNAGIFSAVDVGLDVPDGTELYVPPAIRHEIGADALAMMYKSGFLEDDRNCMVTDYGTNAEMALKVGDDIFTGSAAAGPAMEGQSIKYGMLAAPHVISDVSPNEDGTWNNMVLDDHLAVICTSRVNPLTGEEVKVLDYPARGITGTGVVAAMAVGLETGAITLPNIMNEEGRIKLTNGIYFTSDDVREAGKAMGAIRAGHRTLMKEVGITDDQVKVMYMAGASGTYVDPVKAQYCGMIPRVLDEVYQLGNTSLMMAHDLLSDPETLDRMQSVAKSISANHIMFAGNEVFEKMYVLELAYWTEGMTMDMYNDMMEMEGLGRMPDLVPPKKVVRIVKSDIPDVGATVHSMDVVGIILAGSFDGCTGCKSCQRKCPERALTVLDLPDGRHEINVRSDLCLGTACRQCEMMNCPEKVYRFDMLKGKV